MKVRVLHCIYDDPANPWVAGGGAVRVFELYRRLVGELREVTVATGSFPGARDEVIDGVQYRRLGAAGPYAWSRLTYASAASRLLKEGSYDVAVFDFSTYTPIWIPRHRPVGLTVHHITGPTAKQRWGRMAGSMISAYERRMLRRARWISVTSSATQVLLETVVPSDTQLIPVGAGVPDQLFQLERNEQDYLLYFGRLDWFQKGLDTLLDAMAVLVRERPELQLWVAGRGKDAKRVEEYGRELGILSNLRLLGSVSDEERQSLLAGARVLLMPSRFEGFGMVAAEAMAAGVPLVAAAAGSLPEVVAPPEGGMLFPPGNADALAAAVDRLLSSDDARAALSVSARRSAERFRWERVARQHFEFLNHIHQDASRVLTGANS